MTTIMTMIRPIEAYPVGLTIDASFEARVEIPEIHADRRRESRTFPLVTVRPRACDTMRDVSQIDVRPNWFPRGN